MLEAAIGLEPLPVAFGAGGLLALAYVARNAREICFIATVAGAVAAALAFRKARRSSVVIEIGGIGTLTFRPRRT